MYPRIILNFTLANPNISDQFFRPRKTTEPHSKAGRMTVSCVMKHLRFASPLLEAWCRCHDDTMPSRAGLQIYIGCVCTFHTPLRHLARWHTWCTKTFTQFHYIPVNASRAVEASEWRCSVCTFNSDAAYIYKQGDMTVGF
jgi:hypothetical protein